MSDVDCHINNLLVFFFSSRRRHTRLQGDWSSDVCSSDLNAYFRLAFNANRFFDYDRAVENYRTLADSQRFTASTDARVQEFRTDSLINTAKILEYQQQNSRAAEYYRRAADRLSGLEQTTAVYRPGA